MKLLISLSSPIAGIFQTATQQLQGKPYSDYLRVAKSSERMITYVMHGSKGGVFHLTLVHFGNTMGILVTGKNPDIGIAHKSGIRSVTEVLTFIDRIRNRVSDH